MTPSGRLSVPLLAVLLGISARPAAWAMMYVPPLYELAEASDLVLVCEIAEVGDVSATARVREVLDGEPPPEVITVSPIDAPTCVGRYGALRPGEEAVLFLNAGDGDGLVIAADGHGKLVLTLDTRGSDIAGVRRLIEIMSIEDEDARNRAMLAAATSPHLLLRRDAHHYIFARLRDSRPRLTYGPELLDLLSSDEDDVRLAALGGLHYTRVEGAVPRLVAASQDDDVRIASAASMALECYDTEESVAALIALTKHADPKLRVRAAIDLDTSRRPEAIEAVSDLLDDEDPYVREIAAGRYAVWFRRGDAQEVIPKLVAMLEDPSDEVQGRAADSLGETGQWEVVGPLLDVLRRPDVAEHALDWATKSLAQLYWKAGSEAKALIDADIDLVIEALDSGQWHASWAAIHILDQVGTAQAKAALKRAAEEHPNPRVRDQARRFLDQE